MCAHTASHTAIMISHPFSDEWMRKRKSAVALYCPPSKVERRERTQSDCGKKSDKSHRNKRNLSLTTLALSPLSAVYTEQTPVAGQETTAHTNKNCKPHTRSHTHTHTHTGDRVAFPCPLRVWVGRSSGWGAAVSSVSGLINSGKQCNSFTIPFSSPLTHSPFFLSLSAHPFPLLRSLLSWSAASAFTMGWSVTFAKIYHISVQHNKQRQRRAMSTEGGHRASPAQNGGIISHASSEWHMRLPNKTNIIAKIFSWNTINAFKFSKKLR